jgi:hypothetical protein
MKAQPQANISAEAGIRKGACRYCRRPMPVLRRLLGARFCSPDHKEKARRRHVELINLRLEESDITRNLRRCDGFQCYAPRPADGQMPEFRNNLEFHRHETPVLPGLDQLVRSMRLAQPIGDEQLLEPAPCPPAKARMMNAAREPRQISMPALNSGLAREDRLRYRRIKVAVAPCRSAA